MDNKCLSCGKVRSTWSKRKGLCWECWSIKRLENRRRMETGEAIYCRKCGVALDDSNYPSYIKDHKLIRCRDCYTAYVRKYLESHKEERAKKRFALKVEIIRKYGGKCACCGETEIDFLNIDHPNGDGAAHRKSVGVDIYPWLKRKGFPSGFQVLCMNCNFAKGAHGVCPHEIERQKAAVNG